MRQLELKDICGYLPYGLKSANKYVAQFGLTKPLIENVTTYNIIKFLDGSVNSKIVLRPLSYLTKDIIHKGETFMPLDYFIDKDCDIILNAVQIKYMSYIPHNLYQKLQEWMFDINFLIDIGLAIDINTLDQNTY